MNAVTGTQEGHYWGETCWKPDDETTKVVERDLTTHNLSQACVNWYVCALMAMLSNLGRPNAQTVCCLLYESSSISQSILLIVH